MGRPAGRPPPAISISDVLNEWLAHATSAELERLREHVFNWSDLDAQQLALAIMERRKSGEAGLG